MPSGCAAPTSIVLISFIVLVSNIEPGLLLVKPWPDFGSTAAPLPPTVGNLADRLERVEVEDREPSGDGGHRWRRVGRRHGARPAARDVQPAAGDVGIDVVRAAFAADSRGLQHLVRAGQPAIAPGSMEYRSWRQSPASL